MLPRCRPSVESATAAICLPLCGEARAAEELEAVPRHNGARSRCARLCIPVCGGASIMHSIHLQITFAYRRIRDMLTVGSSPTLDYVCFLCSRQTYPPMSNPVCDALSHRTSAVNMVSHLPAASSRRRKRVTTVLAAFEWAIVGYKADFTVGRFQ